ncbi:MAG: divergent polysaccharide deacetylase family protein [Alphaproteobacteria bacterium]|jgi:polysaccharide deacetylase 2 family uncharacterized protein YibQ|nr:divergent polysaccharide deacetylase family protein [Alphaproteobacteria bacterium]
MKKLFNYIYVLFSKVTRISGPLLILFTLVAVVVIGGGKYFWKEKPRTLNPTPQMSLPASEAEEATETEEEDVADEEDSSTDQSPWTLLQTGLPSRYFEPPTKSTRPTVTIILTDLGLNKNLTDQVLTTLQGPFILAFNPNSPNLHEQLTSATRLGFSVLIALPMEPYNYPNVDPGPLTLLTGVKAEQNIEKTKAILDHTPKGTGVIGLLGSRFTISKTDLDPVLQEIKRQGRIFIDPNTTPHTQVQETCESLQMPYQQVDLTLPLTTSSDQVDEFLKKIIQNSKENDNILISVPAIPEIVNVLPAWVDTLNENGIELEPMPNFTNTKASSDTVKN